MTDPAVPAPVVPRLLELQEFGSAEVSLSEILSEGRLWTYENIAGRGYYEVQFRKGTPHVRAAGHIGFIPINDRLSLQVKPRVPLSNVSRLMQVSGVAPIALAQSMRAYDLAGGLYPSLATLYATALRSQIELITGAGFHKEYQGHATVTSFPYGRIDLGRTVQQHARGIAHRTAIRYFRRTVDNAPNRALRYAVWWLSKYAESVRSDISTPDLRRLQRDLNYCFGELDGVTLDPRREFLKDPLVRGAQPLPSVRAYYRPALDLALAIIGRQGLVVETSGSGPHLPSLIINMEDVFEVYARELLRLGRGRGELPGAVLDGNVGGNTGAKSVLFPGGESRPMTPDIVVQDAAGANALIIEVKYKPAKAVVDRSDLEQTITYAMAYGARCGLLLQPRGSLNNSGLHRLGPLKGVEFYKYVFDAGSETLPAEETHFVKAISALVTS